MKKQPGQMAGLPVFEELKEDGTLFEFDLLTFNNDKKRGPASNIWAASIKKGVPQLIFDHRIRGMVLFENLRFARAALHKLKDEKKMLFHVNGRYFIGDVDAFISKGKIEEVHFYKQVC